MRRHSKPLALLVLFGVAVALGRTASARNLEYRNEELVWRTVVERRPHWQAHANLGEALQRAGRHDEAIGEHREALPLNPQAPEPRFNLALDLERTGQIDEALTEYRADLHLRPADARAQNQLGGVLQGWLYDT